MFLLAVAIVFNVYLLFRVASYFSVNSSLHYVHAQSYNLVSSGAEDALADVWKRNASAQRVAYK